MVKARYSTEIAFGRQSPIRDAFIKRSAHVIERLAERADDATLVEAMAAPTDFGTLARVLTDVGVIGTAVAELDRDALDLAREIENRDKLVQRAGGMLSAEESGHILHIGASGRRQTPSEQSIARRSSSRGLALSPSAVP